MSAAGLLLLVVLYTWLDYLMEQFLLLDPRWRTLMRQYQPDYYSFLQRGMINDLLARILSLGIVYQLFLGLSLPLVIKISIEYSREQVRRTELARQNLQLELNFLRAQVNPHFLFNTLNNIYSLILHDKKNESADIVARLSAFMRYSLHEANTERVPVEKEVRLMEDYVELEKIRLNHIQVRSHFGKTDSGCRLPPLLLIPFLENAFKYCPDRAGAIIDIRLTPASDRLEFSCRNTYDPGAGTAAPGGIGLNNVAKRLEQYYPGRYNYEVSREGEIYSVKLSISML
jgi:sensor histidine kinase YesM